MTNFTSVRSSSFLRLRQEGRTEEVTRRLIEMIDFGMFAEGQQLPSETELSMQLGVATVTLRDALAELRERGVIETRRGRNGGSFVCTAPDIAIELLLQRLRQHSSLALRDLGDELMAISGAAARLAAQRAAKQQHVQLQLYIEALANSSSRLERRRADARFHIEVAVAAQSVRLTRAEMRLQAEVSELLWIDHASLPDAAAMAAEHQAILDAIVAADANLAGTLAEAHINHSIKRLIGLRLQLLAEDE
jgi:GntR family transcriptional repressor for pyruvate dehydrogenase complex